MKRGDYTTRFRSRHARPFLYHARRWKRPSALPHRPPRSRPWCASSPPGRGC